MRHKDLTPDQKRIYISLTNAKQRCTNPKYHAHEHYGGKGIKYLLENTKSRIQVVLEQTEPWTECKNKHPDEVITINRIDSDAHYEERNIHWVPRSENLKQMSRDNKNNPRMKEAKRRNGLLGAKANSKPVKCLTSGKEYTSTAEAGRTLKIWHTSISDCCRGGRKSAGKYKGKPRVWVYI